MLLSIRQAIPPFKIKAFAFLKLALGYILGAAVILPTIVLMSTIKVFGLYLLEIVLFGNLFLMISIIPFALIFRK
jgi:hypothetical protein